MSRSANHGHVAHIARSARMSHSVGPGYSQRLESALQFAAVGEHAAVMRQDLGQGQDERGTL